MEWKEQNGQVLYGYSLENLQANTKWTRRLVYAVSIIGTFIIIYIIWLTLYVMKHNILTNIVKRCVC